VKVPAELLTAGNLSDAALRLWLIISAYQWEKQDPFPSVNTLSRHMNRSRARIFVLLTELEESGYLKRYHRDQYKNYYRLLTPCQPVQDSRPVQETRPESDVLKQTLLIRGETHPSDASTTDAKKQSKKAPQAKPKTQTKEEVEQAVNALDLQKFRDKYSTLNIDTEFENFQDHFLAKNDLKSGKPNWLKWSDWNRAFHRWCKNAVKWNGDGSAPPSLEGTCPQDLGPEYREWIPND